MSSVGESFLVDAISSPPRSKALWIVGSAALAIALVCCTPLRHRVNYAIEVLSGAHGVGLDYEKRRQTYYRTKFSEKERESLVSEGTTTNPFSLRCPFPFVAL